MAKDEIEPTGTSHALGYDGDSLDKKESRDIKDVSVQAAGDFYDVEGIHGVAAIEHDLNVTEKDALEAEEKMGKLSLDEVREIMQEVLLSHEHDQNFPATVIERIRLFLDNDEVFTHPHLHAGLINEMKLEAILVTENSPYAEVRAVVDNTDNVDEPASTLRAWLIGTLFVVAGAFINQLFSIRLPAIKVHANVAQLLAFPCGRILAAVLPDKRFRLFGHEMSLNPGPFNRKEHMMITIMANVGFNVPYTENIILTQYLKQFFNQAYATDFAYQILVGLGTNFVGFGLAGLARRFLVWPAYCVWPTSLVTIALNRAFHTEPNMPVAGPFGKTYTWSRMRLFFVLFAIMFVYFWFPGFIFPVLSTFNWISWISPDNQVLNNIVGSNNGLGINPLPTFDWNIVTGQLDPLVIPWFTTINCFLGMITAGFMIVGMYWTNAYNTGYLPINSNRVFDNMGKAFNVSRVIDSRGIFDDAKYQSYSMPWMAAGNLTIYFWFFAVYSATITYAVLFHRREIWMGLKNVVKRRREADKFEDVHMRLMRNYKEVPEWWFLIVLCVAMGCGMAGIGAWQTYTTPAVVIYGVVLAIFFVVPVGIIYAITGIQVTLNVLAEFIGGAWVAGNALAMNYFKAFGYITTAQALYFSNDLKLAHYVKIPPRVTFSAQIWAVLVSTFVCTGIFNFQMTKIPNVCTSAAPFGFSCPGVNTFFTAAVFWGTLGPHKLFGLNGQYKEMLIGFPVGFILVIAGYVAKRIAPRNTWVRMYHPVAFTTGALFWAPYNMTYVWPAVPIAFVTWMVIKPRYLAFWSKYNYIVSAAFASGVAIAGLVIFFGVQLPEVEFAWWGTDQISVGCEGTACRRLPLPAKGFFGPEKGNYVE